MNILIVDDSPAIQVIVRRALEKEGFAESQFRAANSGLEALDIIAEWSPDLIITDWHMPGMTGLELLQVLHQTHTQRHLVGFVTTESVQERLNEAMHNGAAFILSKPFTDQELGNAVRSALTVQATERKAAAAVASKAAEKAPLVSFGVNDPGIIERYLQDILKTPVVLNEILAVDFVTMPMPCFLAFYGLDTEAAIRAFCVLDQAAFSLIGRLLGGDAVEQSSSALNEAVTSFFTQARQTLFMCPPTQSVTLLRSQLLAQITPKLLELLDKRQGRTCLSISAPGHAPGLITLIAR